MVGLNLEISTPTDQQQIIKRYRFTVTPILCHALCSMLI